MREACGDGLGETMCGAECRCSEVVVVVAGGDAAVELLLCFPRGWAGRGGRSVVVESCFAF